MNYALNPNTMRGLNLDFSINPRTNPAVSSQALPLGTQGNPVVVGSLDSRAQPSGVMSPKVSKGGMVGQVLLPALAGALAGPAGAAAGAIFGIASAAGKYRLSKDPLAQAQYAQALAEAQAAKSQADLINQDPDLARQLLVSKAYGQQPAALRELAAVNGMTEEEFQRYLLVKRGPPADFGAPVYDYRTGQWVLPPKRAGIDPQGTGIQGPTSQSGIQGESRLAGSKAFATAQGEIDAQTAPENVERVAEAGAEVKARSLTAEEQAKANEGQYYATSAALNDFRKTRNLLQRIYTAVQNGPETGPVEQYRAIVDPDLQELRSYIEQNTLASYAAARAQGVTFGSTTESEWKKIASLGAQLGNTREANLRILEAALDQIDEQIGEAAGKVRRIPEGRGRMPPPEAPAKRPPLSSFERPY